MIGLIIYFYLTFPSAPGKMAEDNGEDGLMDKRILPAAAFAVLAVLTWYLSTLWSPQEIQSVLENLGIWAPLAYVGLFTLLPAFFFPVAVLALAGGLLFGLWRGSVYTFVGALFNCTLMFWLSRNMGRSRIEALIREKLSPRWQNRLTRLEGKEGFALLVLLRLIPAVPYNLINYAFGLTGMSWGSYILASAIGIIPGTLAFINIGDKALDPGSPGFWAALGLLLALLVVTGLLGKIIFKEKSK